MKLIVGLGNPGLRYRNTRHNVGFLVIDNFAKLNKDKCGGVKVTLLKPRVFMNNSGVVVKGAVHKFGLGPKDALIVCDDINLRLGIIRFRARGSAGGHRGLQSIIDKLRSEDFNRLRIGIGMEKGVVLKDYVLSKFRSSERKLLKEVIDKATEAVGIWIKGGIEAAMNRFNTKNDDGGEKKLE